MQLSVRLSSLKPLCRPVSMFIGCIYQGVHQGCLRGLVILLSIRHVPTNLSPATSGWRSIVYRSLSVINTKCTHSPRRCQNISQCTQDVITSQCQIAVAYMEHDNTNISYARRLTEPFQYHMLPVTTPST